MLKNEGNCTENPEIFKFVQTDIYIDDEYDDEDEEDNQLYKIDYAAKSEIKNDLLCYFCKEDNSEAIIYPCRICTKVFHMKCIEQKGFLRSEEERKLILQAYSNIGWSCFECVGLIGCNKTLNLV